MKVFKLLSAYHKRLSIIILKSIRTRPLISIIIFFLMPMALIAASVPAFGPEIGFWVRLSGSLFAIITMARIGFIGMKGE